MKKLYSNGPSKDFVVNPFCTMIRNSKRLHIAAPYVTKTDELVEAAKSGKAIDLLVGLNSSTSPEALNKVIGIPNLAIRYLTRRFHAKIFVFDAAAMVGSSNLTEGGMMVNREATLCLDQPEDFDTIEELRSLFLELWESGLVLTPLKLKEFGAAIKSIPKTGLDPDALIEAAVGRAEPININVDSKIKTSQRIFLEGLRQQVYEQYRPSFNEITDILQSQKLRRAELEGVGAANETNRFLNWVRLTYVSGDDAWQSAPLRSQQERKAEILRLGSEWVTTDHPRIPADYIDWLHKVQAVFGTEASILDASKEQLTNGLMCLHAFAEQLRFVKGGAVNLPGAFWSANNGKVEKVKEALNYLIYGQGDFIERLHDILYDPNKKLGFFGRFCALELYGTIKPVDCPPMNGRMAKALRYLGFDVRGA